MAKKLSEFLKNLVVKAGGNPEDEALKGALTALNADYELADELVSAIDNGLLSISTAKNNYPELKNHYFAQAYKGLDSELDKVIESEHLPEEAIAELRQETSSTKRAAKLALKIKELEAKKGNAKQTDTTKLNEQIVDLNNQLRAEKDARAQLEQEHGKNIKSVKKSYAMNQLLSGYQTIHDGLDPETKGIILNALINKHLKAKNATLDINDKDEFILLGENNSNVFTEDNRLLTPKTFIDKVLADEKMLKVNDSNNNNGNNNNNNNSYRPNNGQHFNNGQNGNNFNNNGGQNGNQRKDNAVLRELLNKSQSDIEKAEASRTRIG